MRWLGVLLIGCGGLADDSRHRLPLVATDAGALAPDDRKAPEPGQAEPPGDVPETPEDTRQPPRAGGPDSATVGAACGDAIDASRSITVGGITLAGDEACGARGVCLISVAPAPPVCDPGALEPTECVVRTTEDVVPVPPLETQALEVDHVCSCRCDGPAPRESHCECPSGTACVPLVLSAGVGGRALAQVGSYCIP